MEIPLEENSATCSGTVVRIFELTEVCVPGSVRWSCSARPRAVFPTMWAPAGDGTRTVGPSRCQFEWWSTVVLVVDTPVAIGRVHSLFVIRDVIEYILIQNCNGGVDGGGALSTRIVCKWRG